MKSTRTRALTPSGRVYDFYPNTTEITTYVAGEVSIHERLLKAGTWRCGTYHYKMKYVGGQVSSVIRFTSTGSSVTYYVNGKPSKPLQYPIPDTRYFYTDS